MFLKAKKLLSRRRQSEYRFYSLSLSVFGWFPVVLSPLLLISYPGYSNFSTSSIFFPSKRKSSSGVLICPLPFSLFLALRRSFFLLPVSTRHDKSISSSLLQQISVVSSSYPKFVRFIPPNLTPPSNSLQWLPHDIFWVDIEEIWCQYAALMQAFVILNFSVSLPSILTAFILCIGFHFCHG